MDCVNWWIEFSFGPLVASRIHPQYGQLYLWPAAIIMHEYSVVNAPQDFMSEDNVGHYEDDAFKILLF